MSSQSKASCSASSAKSSSNLIVVKIEPAEIKLEPETEAVHEEVVVKRERGEPLEEGECSSSDAE